MRASLAIDSSAIVAILNGEPEAHSFLRAIDEGHVSIGWATIFEVRLWLLRGERFKPVNWFNDFVALAETTTIPFDGVLEPIATEAFLMFGKGRHPAKLNFGDCMAYAVARAYDLPLLFKGGDFGLTDVRIHEASVRSA